MRSPRSVTMQPMGMFSRILKFAMALRVRVMAGFWPAILVMSATALSIIFLSFTASPTPMLRVILVMRGTCMSVL